MYTRPYMELKASLGGTANILIPHVVNVHIPFQEKDNAKPCVLTDILSDISQDKEGRDRSVLEDIVINTTGTAYSGESGVAQTYGLLLTALLVGASDTVCNRQ